MPVIRIDDLATVMVEMLAPQSGYEPKDIEIRVVGKRSGEKLYEELLTDEEVRRSIDLEDLYIVLPAFRNLYNNIVYEYPGETKQVENIYCSRDEKVEDADFVRTLLDGTMIEM